MKCNRIECVTIGIQHRCVIMVSFCGLKTSGKHNMRKLSNLFIFRTFAHSLDPLGECTPVVAVKASLASSIHRGNNHDLNIFSWFRIISMSQLSCLKEFGVNNSEYWLFPDSVTFLVTTVDDSMVRIYINHMNSKNYFIEVLFWLQIPASFSKLKCELEDNRTNFHWNNLKFCSW